MIWLAMMLVAPVETDTKAIRAKLEAVDAAIYDYDTCLFAFADNFGIKSSEPAVTVADAAFGDCTLHASEYRGAIIDLSPNMPPAKIDDMLQQYKARRREFLLTHIIKKRAKKP